LREREIEAETGQRRCTVCTSMKPLDEFYGQRQGLQSTCQDCTKSWARAYSARRRELRRAGDEHLRSLRRQEKRRARQRKRAQLEGAALVTLQLEATLLHAIDESAHQVGISAERWVELILTDLL
jgi:hypothetical protein